MDIKGSKAWDVLGGKTARACESCLVKRARWFCAADDAFLCQPCDASVHSTNQLANKHDRVALGTSSTPAAAWFTRKPRTPRINPKNQTLPLVPEINNDDPNSPEEENGEQLLYRVPVFDPLPEGGDQDEGIANMLLDDDEACHGLNLAELLSTCGEELAADVEGLLGRSTGIQEDFAYLRSSYTDHISHYESNRIGESLDAKGVKVEEDDEVQEMIACHYASNSSMTGEETKGAASVKTTSDMDSRSSEYSQVNTRTVSLRLNYEAVMAAWASQGSPWTKGTRPQLDIDEFMVHFLYTLFISILLNLGNKVQEFQMLEEA